MNGPKAILAPREQRALLWLCVFGIFGSLLNYYSPGGYPAVGKSLAPTAQVALLAEDKEIQVDIRTASKEDLMLLPGIGEVRASAIIARREQKQFESLHELLEIKGIGPKTFAKMLPMLVPFGALPALDASEKSTQTAASDKSSGKEGSASVKSKTPALSKDQLTNVVNLNSATLDELCTLPGIGEVKARAILDYRTQNGAFQSIEDITKVKGIGAKTLEKIRSRLSI